jgi:hypothetical protein
MKAWATQSPLAPAWKMCKDRDSNASKEASKKAKHNGYWS